MHKIFTLLIIVLISSKPSRASNEIIIVYPNAQDVSFNVNSVYPIIWNSNISINSQVEILLSINGGKNYFIRLGTSLNDGFELVRIPPHLSSSSTCKIKVQVIDNQLFSDESDVGFVITSDNWEFLLDNVDSVRVPQNELMANIELYAFFMRPFKKWNYQFTTSNSISPIFFHQQITPPLGCSSEQQIQQFMVKPLVFLISKSGTYRFSHTKENGTNNFNTVNILNNSNQNSCDGLLSSSYVKYSNNGVPTIRRYASLLIPFVRGNLYAAKIYNDNSFNDLAGYLEIFESTVRGAQYYEVQIPQPNILSTFVAVDSNNIIRQICTDGNFSSLSVGTYWILALGYLQNYDYSLLINQKITEIDFNSQNLLVSGNVKILEITPKCPANSILTDTFYGELKESVIDNIISTQKIINSSNISYQAGKSIILQPGFFVNKINLFKAEIKNCQ